MMRKVHMEVGGDYTAREGYLIIRIIFGTVYCTLKVTNLLRSGIPREVHKGLGMARGDDTAREGYLDIQIIFGTVYSTVQCTLKVRNTLSYIKREVHMG